MKFDAVPERLCHFKGAFCRRRVFARQRRRRRRVGLARGLGRIGLLHVGEEEEGDGVDVRHDWHGKQDGHHQPADGPLLVSTAVLMAGREF